MARSSRLRIVSTLLVILLLAPALALLPAQATHGDETADATLALPHGTHPGGALSGTGLVWTGDSLLVFGGDKGWNETAQRSILTADVWEYYPSNDTWRARAPLPLPRANASAAFTNGYLVVAGGTETRNDDGTYNAVSGSLLLYRRATDEWFSLPGPWYDGESQLSLAYQGIAAVAHNGTVYFLGGCGWSCTSQIVKFRPGSSEQPTYADMSLPIAVGYGVAVSDGSRILHLGGMTSSSNMQVAYFPPTYHTLVVGWTPGVDAPTALDAALPAPRAFASGFHAGERVYLVGGANATATHADMLAFTPSTGANASMPLPAAMNGGASAWAGGFAYATGQWRAGGPSSDLLQLSPVPLAKAARVVGESVTLEFHRALAAGTSSAGALGATVGGFPATLGAYASANDRNVTFTLDGGAGSGDQVVLSLGNVTTLADAYGNQPFAFSGLVATTQTPLHTLPSGRIAPGVVWTGSEALVFGGRATAYCGRLCGASTLLSYQPTTGIVRTVGVMPTGCCGAATMGPDAAWFVGANGAVLRYDGALTTLTTLDGAYSSAAVAHDGVRSLYVFGGYVGNVPVASVLRIDTVNGSVTSLPAMPGPRHGASAVWADGGAYIVGGYDAQMPLADVLRFDPATGQTTLLDVRLPDARGFGAAYWDGASIVVLGGTGSDTFANATRVFPARNESFRLPTVLAAPRESFGVAWTGTNAILLGGGAWNGEVFAANTAPETFVHDTLAPSVTLAAAPAAPNGLGGWYNTSVTLTASATDAGGVLRLETSLDNLTYTGAAARTLAASGTVHARAVDASGNLGYAAPRSVLVDTIAPTATASGDLGALPGANATVRFAFSEAMDVTTTQAALRNASGWLVSWDGSTGLTLTRADVPLGSHVIEVGTDARDAHGVPLAAPAARSVERVDRSAPNLTVTLAPAAGGLGGWHLEPVTATLAGTDDVGIAELATSLDGGGFVVGATRVIGEGAHTLVARATDVAGNATTLTLPVNVDLTRPTATASGTSGATNAPQANVTFAFSEPMDRASTEAALRNATGWTRAWSENDTRLTLSRADLPLGAHVLEVSTDARDAHGQPLATPASRSLERVDTGAPSLNVTLSPNATGLDGWWLENVTVTLAATDDTGIVELATSLDGGAFVPGATRVVGEGLHTLVARATDLAGNATTQSLVLRVDLTRPTVALSGANGTSIEPNATVVLDFSEPMDRNSTETALRNASGWTRAWSHNDTRLTLTNADVPLGTHTIELTTSARDAHGQPLAAPASRTFARDAPPAPVAMTPGAPSSLAALLDGTQLRISWSPPATDGGAPLTGYRVLVDGQLVAETAALEAAVPAPARGATHLVQVQAANRLGHGPAAERSVPLPPTSDLQLTGATGANGWRLAPVRVELRADPADAAILVDTGAGERAYTGSFELPVGETLLRWRAESGGLSEPARETLVRVDGAAPALTPLAAPTSAAAGATLPLAARATDDASGVASVRAILGGVAHTLAPQADGSWRADVAAPGEGSHALAYVATDGAGRETTVGASTLVVASAAPAPTPDAGAPPAPPALPGETPLEQTSGQGGADDAATQPTESAPEPEVVIEQPEDVDVGIEAGARGVVTVTLLHVADLSAVRVVLVDADGQERTLSEGAATTTWDTTEDADGYYTVEARQGDVTLASARVLVRNPASGLTGATGAAVAGVLAAAAATAGLSAVSSGATSAASSTVGGFDPLGFAQEVAIDAGQDKLKQKTAETAAIDRRRRVRSVVATLIGAALLAAFWAYAEVDGWSFRAWLLLLPVVGSAAALVGIMKYGSEGALAWVTHAAPRVRLWVAGAVSLLVSSVAFGQPFGYPAYVHEVEDETRKGQRRMEGRRALATLAGAAAFMVPFLALSAIAPWSFVEVGLLIAVTNVATMAMPFGPLPGREVWRWSKTAAIAGALAGFALYVGFSAALLPMWALWSVALAGGIAYAASLVAFRRALGPAPRAARRVPIARNVPVQDGDAAATAKADEADVRGERKLRR